MRRPPAWYAHLLAAEDAPLRALPPRVKGLLARQQQMRAALTGGQASAPLLVAPSCPRVGHSGGAQAEAEAKAEAEAEAVEGAVAEARAAARGPEVGGEVAVCAPAAAGADGAAASLGSASMPAHHKTQVALLPEDGNSGEDGAAEFPVAALDRNKQQACPPFSNTLAPSFLVACTLLFSSSYPPFAVITCAVIYNNSHPLF